MSSSPKPKLPLDIAHVLFMDIVGYSKLRVDEQSERLRQLNQIVRGTEQFRVAEAADKLIRMPTGDGMALAFFRSQDEPLHCAIEVSEALKSHPELPLRMGINSGPVDLISDVNDRSNVAGAGINLAQRVMDCGDAGHILLSKRVADDLAQYGRWQPYLHDLGEVEVKHGVRMSLVNFYTDEVGNSAPPQKIGAAAKGIHRRADGQQQPKLKWMTAMLFAGATVAALAYFYYGRSAPKPSVAPLQAKSIAVLPLENLSDDKENAFFADGIQDDVLTSLAKIKDLKVISRTSVMGYRDKTARNLKQIGKELGVANVLEGSVRRVGNRVLVIVQLIDTATDQHLWAERYDRTLADSITLQGELASEIAGALRSTLSPEEKARIAQKPTDNPEAYEFYLRGREVHLRTETSRENYLTAINFYKQAVVLDPQFVLARARLSYIQGWLYWLFEPTNEALAAEARANAEEALRLDANSAEAHLALARCALQANNDARTKQEIATALRLNPNDAAIAMAAAITQQNLGLLEEAAASYKRAADLGPREPKVYYNYGTLLRQLHRLTEANAALDHALEFAPDSVLFRVTRAGAEISATGDIARAKVILAALPAGRDPDGRATSIRCWLAVLERNFPEALRILQAYPGENLNTVGGGWALEPKAISEGVISFYAGDYARAYECFDSFRWQFEVATRDQPDSVSAHSDLALLYATMGWKMPALAEVARTIELETATNTPSNRRNNWAVVFARIGDLDRAMPELEKILVPPNALFVNDLRLDPVWDPFRNDPRFKKLLETKQL
jgi:TolB-like protein